MPRVSSRSEDSPSSPRRACDVCRAQKTACHRYPNDTGPTTPCRTCVEKRIAGACTYLEPPKAKGPKPGSRGHRQQGQGPQPGLAGRRSIVQQRVPDLFTEDIAQLCFDHYTAYSIQSSLPILTNTAFEDALRRYNDDDEVYAQLCAFCAYICLLPTWSLTSESEAVLNVRQRSGNLPGELRREAIDMCQRLSQGLHIPENITTEAIRVTVLLSEVHRLLGQHERACVYAKLATSLAMSLLNWPNRLPDDADRLIFWTLFIQERLWAMDGRNSIDFVQPAPNGSHREFMIDGMPLVGFFRRVEIMKSYDASMLPSLIQAPDLSKEFKAHFENILQRYLHLQLYDRGDWFLDLVPAVRWLENGLRYILENEANILSLPYPDRPWTMAPHHLTIFANIIHTIVTNEPPVSEEASDFLHRLRVSCDRLRTGGFNPQQFHLPPHNPFPSPIHQVNIGMSTPMHNPISPIHATPTARYPSPTSRNPSFDAASPTNGQYLPSATLTYQSPRSSVYPAYAALDSSVFAMNSGYGYPTQDPSSL